MWLSAFIRERKGEILADWARAIRALPIARSLPHPLLMDHVPSLLEHIAKLAELGREPGGAAALPQEIPANHAFERLDEGYDLGEVVTEYAVLRECILRHWEEHGADDAAPVEVRTLNRAIDFAISISVERFTSVRQRTLLALDRISAAAVGSTSIESFLPSLLSVLKDTTPAVDWAVVFLLEADRLVVRAEVGRENNPAAHVSLAIGQGFAGLVAQQREVLSSDAGKDDPRVVDEFVRVAETRALIGLPLLHDDTLVGVAEIGSRTAADFSREDRLLFSIMCNRATAMIEQHRLRELAEHRAAELVVAVRARDEVLAIVSHDLRSPLAAISLSASLLRDNLSARPDDLSLLARVERAALRMDRLIEDLLDATRIETGKLMVEPHPERAATLVRDAVEGAALLGAAKGCEVVAGPLDEALIVLADRHRILQLFSNLLGNALKFTRSGGRITVSLAREGGLACFSVRDTGIGIEPSHIQHLFTRYWKAASTARDGAGLGLYIVQGIVQAHAGGIRVESELRQGTTVHFTLPLAA